MAAYSAIACFKQTLKQLLDSDELHLPYPKPQIQYLYENVSSLQSSLDKIIFVPEGKRIGMNELQIKIRDAIYAAQDEVDYTIKLQKSDEANSLKEIADNINLVAIEAEAMAEEIKNEPHAQNLFSETESTSQPAKLSHRGKDMIVGQEKDFAILTELLKSEDKQRLVIPITGLPGLGKTTLARSIYHSREAQNFFNIRAWVTVSQDYNFQEIYSTLLNSMESKNYQAGHYATRGDEETLFIRVHQELYNLKYLIVIDDVWDTQVYSRVVQALPDKENGSRILLTTRIRTVAQSIQRFGFIHEMQPLGLEDSWQFLCYKIFDVTDEYFPVGKKKITEACPLHLRETGLSIAEKCKGLPLSLTVVGGLLLQERANVEYWKRIEEDTAAAAKGDDDYAYMAILSLSYNSLPPKLKGCFLYMGAFPEDTDIPVSKLIKLWVAEGFLALPQQMEMESESSLDTTLEFEAHKALEDLIDRNLMSVRAKSPNGRVKLCGMHDSLRELAERESRAEKFFHSRKKYDQKPEGNMHMQRRVSIHINMLMSLEEVYQSTKSIRNARSLLYVGPHHHHPLPFCLTFDLLRVLDAFTLYFIRFPNEFLQLVHLTYLALTYNHDLPSKISQLQKLQTLMVRREPKIIFVGVSFLPDEIWKMPQLRHLWFTETDFPALPPSPPEVVLLMNLQTLANVDAAYFTDEVLDNMPNLKKLAMWIEAPDKINFNVSRLKLLEHFKFVVLNPVPGKGIEVDAEQFFPKTLKRVTLSGCGLPWEYMEYVADNLVDLQVLKLKELAFYGGEWILGHYKLKALRYLLMEYLNLQFWEAKNYNFRNLKRLVLRHCYELEEIPQNLGYIGQLDQIEMVDCSPNAVESVYFIRYLQEQYKLDFEVRIFSSSK